MSSERDFPAMRLREALEVNNRAGEGAPFRCLLACGFTPLHLATFLKAYLRQQLSGRPVDLKTGLYEDLTGTLRAVKQGAHDGVVALLEWPDLDPRLGLRQLGGWSPSVVPEIVESARTRLAGLEQALHEAAENGPLVLSPPLLDLPPLFHSVRQQLHAYAAELEALIGTFLARVAERGIRVLNARQLPHTRFDAAAYLGNGFPYQTDFASTLAGQLANLLVPASPKKGLITDLDDTLWRGILGDIGPASISWDLANKTQVHGVYQTLLQSFADAGVLVAAASKNDPANVQEALRRTDLLLAPESIFPVEAGWGPKSESVARILKTWNIGEDAVVFVDDSGMELAQVSAAFPAITTFQFPTREADACWELFGRLRDLFGKPMLAEEDRIRAASLRQSSVREQAIANDGGGMDEFLRQSRGVMRVEAVRPNDTRALELVNKTNQFNLNGRRWTEADWRRMLEDTRAVALAVSYEDKFGPLGKIGVLAGERAGDTLRLHTWVLSCRAFSRRIEHQTLRFLFDEYEISQIELNFEATPKNGPTQQFLAELVNSANVIHKDEFRERCPLLFHTVHSDIVLHERV